MFFINAKAGTIVFEHPMYSFRIMNSFSELKVLFISHCFRLPSIPLVRISEYCPLRLFWLSIEEPVIPLPGKLLITPVKSFKYWNAIKYGKPCDSLWLVESGFVSGVTPSVMPNKRKLLKTKLTHQLNTIFCFSSFRRTSMITLISRL